ncbi:hypothetical protein BDZ97DRAFT_2069884, partial [Flammula alnicola]
MATIDFPLLICDEWAQESHTAIWCQRDPYSTVLNGIECLHECLEPRTMPRTIIIIRDDYKALWDEIVQQSQSVHRGIVVWGQPGIGKTLFLRYALGLALAECTPIILCEYSEYFLYFDDSGVRRIVYNHNDDIEFPSLIIMLFDTTERMCSLHESFLLSSCPAFVVQATSPQKSRWSQWSKQLMARIWIMMPWSREEILQ